MVKLIRENSDTPNITNKDDARMIRYAYGGKDGFVKNRGAELGYTVSGNKFTIQSGVINLQGWEVEIDSDGWSTTASVSDATKRYFTVFCEVNLGTGGTARITAQYDTANFPVISKGDDLTQITNGTARLELYHYTTKSGVISDVEKLIGGIDYVSESLAQINQRLDEMGFKEASVENGEISVNADFADAGTGSSPSPQIEIVKMAKLAVMKELTVRTHTKVTSTISGSGWMVTASGTIATMAKAFAPKAEISMLALVNVATNFLPVTIHGSITIFTDGKITVTANGQTTEAVVINASKPATILCSNAGWELQ